MTTQHACNALSADELALIAGGWCGNEVIPIRFPLGKPLPEPDPDPWYRLGITSKLDMVALNPQPLPPAEIGGFDAGFTLG